MLAVAAALLLGASAGAQAVPVVQAWMLPVGPDKPIWLNVQGAYNYGFFVAAGGDPAQPVASTGLSGSPAFLTAPEGVYTDDVDALGQPRQHFGQAAFSDAALTSLVDGLDSGGWFDTGVRADLDPGQSLLLRYQTSADGPEMFVPALTALPGDVNLDGTVGSDDLAVILENLGATGSQLLSDGSSGMGGGVPLRDVSQVLTYWGSSIDLPAPQPMSTGAAIPEPVTGMLGVFGVLAVGLAATRRRRRAA